MVYRKKNLIVRQLRSIIPLIKCIRKALSVPALSHKYQNMELSGIWECYHLCSLLLNTLFSCCSHTMWSIIGLLSGIQILLNFWNHQTKSYFSIETAQPITRVCVILRHSLLRSQHTHPETKINKK